MERQTAVADLAGRLDLRQELELLGRLQPDRRPDPDAFLAWAEGDRWLAYRPVLIWVSRLSPLLLVLGVAAQLSGIALLPFWLPPLVVNIVLSQTVGRRVYRLVTHVAGQRGALDSYAGQLQLLASAPVAAPSLRRLLDRLHVEGATADRYLASLHRVANLTIPASSIVYGLIQAAILWDFHLLAAMEFWQRSAGSHVRRWLTVLAEVEAIAALATLAHDNPGWAFPHLDPAADRIAAEQLGHPLIAAASRVGNDVALGPPGTFLLVTGSNMSGKSTLLRSIGINAVLAEAGAPVCAKSLTLPPVTVRTSMTVHDSLERGVSYFMAELQRLKGVVDSARSLADRHDRRLLYLLDEILQGTNTAERQIAARRIVRHLVDTGAIGAISTHDLHLADTPTIAAIARPIHFSETVSTGPGPAMTFDYTARPGIATSTNALRLMELIGLDLPALDEADSPDTAQSVGMQALSSERFVAE